MIRTKKKTNYVWVLLFALLIPISLANHLLDASAMNNSEIVFKDNPTSAYLGETVTLGEIYARYPDNVDLIETLVLSPDGNVVEVESNQFTATQEGEYKLWAKAYKGEDCFEDSHTIVVTKAAFPVLAKKPYVPNAFITNEEYPVEKVTFVDYNLTTPAETAYEVFLTDAYGIEKKITDNFTLQTDIDVAEVKLCYVAKSSVTNVENRVEYVVSVVQAFTKESGIRAYDFAAMFVDSTAERIENQDGGVAIYGTRTYRAKFINTIYANFELEFSSIERKTNFESVCFTFSDKEYSSNAFSLEVSKYSDTQVNVCLNGKRNYRAQGTFDDFKNGIKLSFNADTHIVTDGDGNTVCVVNEVISGRKFTSFTDSEANLEITVKGGNVESALLMKSLNGQSLSKTRSKDGVSPFTVFTKRMNTVVVQGHDFVIPQVLVFDLLEPNLKCFVSCTTPDGEVAKASDGTDLYEASADKDYVVNAAMMGEYLINIYCEDYNGNSDDLWLTVLVSERTPPTLTIKNDLSRSAKLGDSITLPKCSYSDNFSTQENLKLIVTISLPYASYVSVSAGDKFTFEQAGMYVVRYTVYDENFNIAYKEYVVMVS